MATSTVVVDVATGGLNILATPAEIAAGSALGGLIGAGIGTIVDSVCDVRGVPIPVMPMARTPKGEKGWEKARGDDPFYDLDIETLKKIEKDKSLPKTARDRARKIRKQKKKTRRKSTN